MPYWRSTIEGMVSYGFTLAGGLARRNLSLLRTWKRSAVDEIEKRFWTPDGHKCLQRLPDGDKFLYLRNGWYNSIANVLRAIILSTSLIASGFVLGAKANQLSAVLYTRATKWSFGCWLSDCESRIHVLHFKGHRYAWYSLLRAA